MPRNTTTTTTTTTTIMIISSLLLLTLIVSLSSSSSSFIVVVHSFALVPTITTTSTLTSTAKTLSTTTLSTTALSMAIRKRGLEQRIEGPTPTEDGMILYLKAGEDGKSVGDCPFGQNIRMILEEKQIKYDIRTCSTKETKPNWLIEYYDGQLPALRHKKECYIETNIIVSYLDYFFPTSENNDENISNKSQSSKQSKTNLDNAEENALGGFFPSIARYLKDVNDDDDENENETLEVLKERLDSLENHFKNLCDENEDNDNDNENNEWCYLDGSKTNFSNLDCRIIPQLYHLTVAVVEFKNGSPNLKEDYPFTYRYLNEGMKRDSFINTKYSKETIVWGWNNARQQQQQSQQLQE